MKAFHTQLQKWISQNKRPKEKNALFWARMIQDTRLTKEFLKIVLTHPRENKATFRLLTQQMTPAEFRKWHQLYMAAYDKQMKELWRKAKKIEDVLKFMPNFSPWALKDKFTDIKIGQVPREFISEKVYLSFLKKLSQSKVVQGYHHIKLYENNLKKMAEVYPEVKKIDWFNLQERQEFLSHLMHKLTGHIFSLTLNQKKFNIRFLCNPFSCKMVFIIEAPNHKKFILKMAAHQVGEITSDYKRKESENQAIRADSPYSNAMMEFYLKFNKSPHAPDIQYYTAQYEAVLYREEQGTEFTPKQPVDFLTLNTHYIKDANRLGIYINDVSPANFRISSKKVMKIIDIGHAQFANPMTQGVPGLTFTFGNLCGQDYLSHFGVMSLED